LGLKAPDESNRREKVGRTERRKQRERERGMERGMANLMNLRLRPMPDPNRSPDDLGPAWLLVANAAASDVAGAAGSEACASRNAYTPMSQVLATRLTLAQRILVLAFVEL